MIYQHRWYTQRILLEEFPEAPQSSDKQMKKRATTTAINSDALRPSHNIKTHNTTINHGIIGENWSNHG